MESSTFKSVAFGGFDKQDVIRYIEKTVREHSETVAGLQTENAELLAKLEALTAQNDALTVQEQENTAALQQAHQQIEQLTAEAERLHEAARKAEELGAELASLRPDAEAYRQFRDRIGDIECEARKRAADLEAETQEKLQAVLAEFRSQYLQLTGTFDVTTNHVNTELRKIEVTLSQLPRALDQIGADLSRLDDLAAGIREQK